MTAAAPTLAARDTASPLGRQDVALAALLFLVGLSAATYLNWPALTNYGIYKADSLQSPHWAAYHTSSFRTDDLVLRYASFNESPLQNAIYWFATYFVDCVPLGKFLAVASYGLLASTFFLVGRSMYGRRFGALLALFILAFPDQWDYSTGFFSKFWAIPLVLICTFALQSRRHAALVALLPFAALAYPSAAVLIGMIAAVHWIQELFADRRRAARLFRCLALGSALAVGILLVKYVAPPEGIGVMRSGAELREMPEVRSGGYPSHYIPIPPLYEQLLDHVRHPFVWLNALVYVLVLGRRHIAWERTWTAVFLASAAGYMLADVFFMRLYIPNRYIRYSLAVLLALWHARNWDLVCGRIGSRSAQLAVIALLIATGVWFYGDSYREGRGWTDRREMTPVATFVRETLPDGVLFAGPPASLDDLMLQGKRSALVPYRLAHPWFIEYYDEMRERTRATLRAHFASDAAELNALHDRYGVTHFLVEKELFERVRERRQIYCRPYNKEVYKWLRGRSEFYLSPAPPALFMWEDEHFAVIELPIAPPPPRSSSGSATADR